MVNPSFRSWARFRDVWATLPSYQRFEVLVAVVLRGVIAAIIVVALYRLIVAVIDTLVIRALNPLDHVVFQAVFGAIMTLLIALEFNHTLSYTMPRGRTVTQARIVIPDRAPGAVEEDHRGGVVRDRRRNGRGPRGADPVARRHLPAHARGRRWAAVGRREPWEPESPVGSCLRKRSAPSTGGP